MPKEINNGWKKHPADKFFHKGSDCFYQKRIKNDNFANIVEYTTDGKKGWELDIQVNEEDSITCMTINILSFKYHELNFKEIEEDAILLIDRLTN